MRIPDGVRRGPVVDLTADIEVCAAMIDKDSSPTIGSLAETPRRFSPDSRFSRLISRGHGLSLICEMETGHARA